MTPGIPRRYLPSRQALLFLAAIGVPCVLLVGLSLRMLAQERELAEKRLADGRRRVAVDINQELLSRLERLRREALSSAASGRLFPGLEAIALVARIERDQIALPWDFRPGVAAAAAALGDPRFAEAIRDGERDELVAQQFDAAAGSYRRALSHARLPSQIAFAELLVARALAKERRPADADALYRRVLEVPANVIDEQGIPFALYAARRLLESADARESDQGPVLESLRVIAANEQVLSPPAIYMLNDLVDAVSARAATDTMRGAAREVARRIAILRRDVDQALALQSGFPTLRGQAATASASSGEPAWVPFGEPDSRWLVGIDAGPESPFVVAVRANPLLASLESVRNAANNDTGRLLQITVHAGGEAVGPSLPGLSLAFESADTATAGTTSLQRSFYLAALGLVVSMTLFGAYLFWRDVRREVRVAEMRTQFVSSVSHELKTPLTAIRMFAETLLLNRSTRPELTHEYLETIVNESERLTRLLNNVLDFSTIDQGRKVYRIEPHALNAIVRTAARAMDYPFSQQGFELRLDIDDTLPPVPADPDAIQQALLNLLSNAMKYSGQGRVVAMRLTRDGDHAVISVIDRGMGIPLAEQSKIFDKFYRITGADRERIPGTGLGLTLVDHIVTAHGGTVVVSSTPGEGSTFSVRLPFAKAHAGSPAAEEALA